MKLFDAKAGTNPRHVRIFLAEKGIDIPEAFTHTSLFRVGRRRQVPAAEGCRSYAMDLVDK